MAEMAVGTLRLHAPYNATPSMATHDQRLREGGCMAVGTGRPWPRGRRTPYNANLRLQRHDRRLREGWRMAVGTGRPWPIRLQQARLRHMPRQASMTRHGLEGAVGQDLGCAWLRAPAVFDPCHRVEWGPRSVPRPGFSFCAMKACGSRSCGLDAPTASETTAHASLLCSRS